MREKSMDLRRDSNGKFLLLLVGINCRHGGLKAVLGEGKDCLPGLIICLVLHQEVGINAFGGRIMHCGTIMDYLC